MPPCAEALWCFLVSSSEAGNCWVLLHLGADGPHAVRQELAEHHLGDPGVYGVDVIFSSIAKRTDVLLLIASILRPSQTWLAPNNVYKY